jgi:hypothetical protein
MRSRMRLSQAGSKLDDRFRVKAPAGLRALHVAFDFLRACQTTQDFSSFGFRRQCVRGRSLHFETVSTRAPGPSPLSQCFPEPFGAVLVRANVGSRALLLASHGFSPGGARKNVPFGPLFPEDVDEKRAWGELRFTARFSLRRAIRRRCEGVVFLRTHEPRAPLAPLSPPLERTCGKPHPIAPWAAEIVSARAS